MADTLSLEPSGAAAPPAGALQRAADFFRPHAGLAAVLVFAVCFLSPLLRSGFYDDDVLNSCTRGFMQMNDADLIKYIQISIRGSMADGRFFPLVLVISHTVHYVFASAVAYKCFIVVLILSNLLEFYYLLLGWNVDRRVAQLGTLSLVLLLQMRLISDPILAYAGILQIEAGQILLAMICLQKYLASQRRVWLLGSVVIYTSALLNYEISFAVLPVFLAMAYAHFRQWRPALAVARPYIIAAALLTAFVFGLRYHIHLPRDNPYRPNLDPPLVAISALNQATAALPVSYALSRDYWHYQFHKQRLFGQSGNWAMFLAAGALTWALIGKRGKGDVTQTGASVGLLAAAGFMVWFLPGLPIATSPKYQTWVRFGVGYLPVYVQYLGMAMLVVCLLVWVRKRFPSHWPKFATGLILANACVAMMTFDTNCAVINHCEAALQINDRQLLEVAFDEGFGDEIPAGATLLTARNHSWLCDGPPHSSGFPAQHLKRKIFAVNGQPPPGRRPLCEQWHDVPRPTWFLNGQCLGRRSGYAAISPLDATVDAPEEKFGARDFRLFLVGRMTALATHCDGLAIIGKSFGSLTNEPGEYQAIDCSGLKVVRSGPDWAICEGSFAHPVDATTIEVRETAALASLTLDLQRR